MIKVYFLFYLPALSFIPLPSLTEDYGNYKFVTSDWLNGYNIFSSIPLRTCRFHSYTKPLFQFTIIMAGRSPSPQTRRRPSPPPRRSRQDSRSPSRDRYRSRRSSRSPPRRDQRRRSYSPSRRSGGSQREIEGHPILPGESFSD